jgi:hypothetical protein
MCKNLYLLILTTCLFMNNIGAYDIEVDNSSNNNLIDF